MSAVAESGMSESTVAESRGVRFFALAGLIVAVHLAALAVLLTTEYGPFAITLSVLAWVFVNCFLLAVLQRPGICAAMALALIGDPDRAVALQVRNSAVIADVPRLPDHRPRYVFVSALGVSAPADAVDRGRAGCGSAVVAALAFRSVPGAPPSCADGRGGDGRIDCCDGGRVARAGMGAVPGRQSHLQSGALGCGGGVAAGFDRMDRGRSAGERSAPPRAGSERRRPACAAGSEACDATAKRPHIIMLLDESSFDVTSAPGIKVPAGYTDYFKSIDGKQRTMIAEATGGPTWYTEFNVLTGLSARSFGDLKFYVTRIAAGRVTRGLPQAPAALRLQDRLALSDLWRLSRRARLPEGHRRRAVHRHGRHGRERGHAARQVLFRSGNESVCARAAAAVAGLHVRLSHRQSFSLDRRLSARSDAGGLDAAGKHRRSRRIHPPPGHDGERVPRIHRAAEARLSGRVVPCAALRRSSAGDLAKNARARHRPKSSWRNA